LGFPARRYARCAQGGMPGWQKRLFLTLAHNAANPADYFGLPIERSISMGGQVSI